MRIVISHVYASGNKGDAALLSVLLKDIRRVFPDSQVMILTMDKIFKGETFEGVPMENAFIYEAINRYRNPILKALYFLFVGSSTLLYAGIYRLTGKKIPLPKNISVIVEHYQEADLIIPIGGGYIGAKSGFINTVRLFFLIHPLIFGFLLGKPTIGYTQSVGPFGNKIQEYIAKFAIKRIDGILVREDITLQLLQKWGITRNVRRSVDSGFLFVSDRNAKHLRKELNIPEDKLVVGITVRKWLKPEMQIGYEKAIADLADNIITNYGAFVVFIPQVIVKHHHDDDREGGKSVYDLMKNRSHAHVMTEEYDHWTIRAIYGDLDYLVGTRFHSVIFAVSSYVPSIAIEYEHKTRGIMRDLGLEHWVVNIKDVRSTQLIELFDKLVANRDIYVAGLKKVLPSYIEQGPSAMDFVKEIYDNANSNE